MPPLSRSGHVVGPVAFHSVESGRLGGSDRVGKRAVGQRKPRLAENFMRPTPR